MNKIKILLGIVLASFLVGCVDMCGPNDKVYRTVYGAEDITPELLAAQSAKIPSYEQLWKEVEQVSGLRYDFNKILFSVGDSVRNQKGKLVLANTDYLPEGRRSIAISAPSDGPKYFYITSIPLIKHEMYHAHGITGHPAKYFNAGCGCEYKHD